MVGLTMTNRNEYVKKYRAEHKEELAAKRREAYRRKKAEEDAKRREEAEKAFEIFAEEARNDPSFIAAKVNQERRYSYVCGGRYKPKHIVIVEKFPPAEFPKPYRLKTVEYKYFSTLNAVEKYCESVGIVFAQQLIDPSGKGSETNP